MDERRVLVSTIAPVSGGVPTMTRFVTDTLQAGGWTPVLAHYEPYSVSPGLSVPAHRLLGRRPGSQRRTTWGNLETHAIGAWLPELEFTHYGATALWRQLMEGCSRFVAVCGNALAALPFAQTGRPFTAWVATGWEEDRRDRIKGFPAPRRWLDRWLNGPVLRRREAAVLRAGDILALSTHTRQVLDGIAGRAVCRGVLPMPIDADFFAPEPAGVVRGRIGFSGRVDDARKNVGLLIEAVGKLAARGVAVSLVLMGGALDAAARRQVERLGIADRVRCPGYLPREALRAELQCLDLFALPSHQEGLCIAALEAMACGCPVVSTRCGGPEEFVRERETGWLVGFDATEMANAIERILTDRPLRDRLAAGARQLVSEHYNRERCESIFWDAFEHSSLGAVN